MSQKKIEHKSLIVSLIINGIMAISGIAVFILTNLQALFLDGIFSLLGTISTAMALIFTKISKKKNSSYPTGMYFLEPLYGIIKSILIFVLLASSLTQSAMSAYQYFAYKTGSIINFTPILPYTIAMVALCFFLHFYNKKQNKKINNISTMLTAEAKSNLVDGVISAGIGILIICLFFINPYGKLSFIYYSGDFFITLLLVMAVIKEPIVLFAMSVREISGATVKDKEIKKTIRKIISKQIKEEDLNNKFEVYKIGKHIKVVVLLEDNIDKEILNRLKTESLEEIKESFDSVTIEYVFRK